MRAVRYMLLSSLLAVAACGGPEEQLDGQAQQAVDVQPDGKGGGTLSGYLSNDAKPTGSLVQAGIQYHGGAVMTATKTIYYIWYGNWSGNTATTILTDFANGIGGSSYFNINTTYTTSGGTPCSNSVVYGGSTTDNYSRGTSLSDSAIQGVVADAINSGRLPKNANGVYFVLTSQDVTASSGFCTQYCGWHTYATIGGTNIKYSFVGNAARCPSSCAGQTAASPNGNVGADGMASIVAHELEEAATDPNLNAWYDTAGAENADKCAWTWGATTTVGSYKYNMTFGGRNWLIQQNWVNSGSGFCAKSW